MMISWNLISLPILVINTLLLLNIHHLLSGSSFPALDSSSHSSYPLTHPRPLLTLFLPSSSILTLYLSSYTPSPFPPPQFLPPSPLNTHSPFPLPSLLLNSYPIPLLLHPLSFPSSFPPPQFLPYSSPLTSYTHSPYPQLLTSSFLFPPLNYLFLLYFLCRKYTY